MLDWEKATAILTITDWRKMTEEGVHRATFSAYLTGLVTWTRLYSEGSNRGDRQFPYEWGHALARELGRFAASHGGGEEWRSLLTFDRRDRDTDLVGDYLDGAIRALVDSGVAPDTGFWNAWLPAARWIMEKDIPAPNGRHERLSNALRAAGMVGPYTTPIPPDWPHLDAVLGTIGEWVRLTAHLSAAAYASLAIVERMDTIQRTRWFLPWVRVWAEINGSDEPFWSYNGLGNKVAALLAPLNTQDHVTRASVRHSLAVIADGGATAARQLIAVFAARRP